MTTRHRSAISTTFDMTSDQAVSCRLVSCLVFQYQNETSPEAFPPCMSAMTFASSTQESPLWAEIDSAGMNCRTEGDEPIESLAICRVESYPLPLPVKLHELALPANIPFWTRLTLCVPLMNLIPATPDAESWAASLSEQLELVANLIPLSITTLPPGPVVSKTT